MNVSITVVLSNLVSCRLILVEIVFSIKSTGRLDVAIQRNGGTQRGEKRCSLEFLYPAISIPKLFPFS